MVIGILCQFIFSFRCNFEICNCFGLLAIQVIAISKHVIFFASTVIFIRKIEFQKLDGLFKLAKVKIRTAQNTCQFGLLVSRNGVYQRSSIFNHLGVFSLFVINLTDVERYHFLENRVLL